MPWRAVLIQQAAESVPTTDAVPSAYTRLMGRVPTPSADRSRRQQLTTMAAPLPRPTKDRAAKPIASILRPGGQRLFAVPIDEGHVAVENCHRAVGAF